VDRRGNRHLHRGHAAALILEVTFLLSIIQILSDTDDGFEGNRHRRGFRVNTLKDAGHECNALPRKSQQVFKSRGVSPVQIGVIRNDHLKRRPCELNMPMKKRLHDSEERST